MFTTLGLGLIVSGLIYAGYAAHRGLVQEIERDPRTLAAHERLTTSVVQGHLADLEREVLRLAKLEDLKEAVIKDDRAELLEQVRPPLNRLGKGPLRVRRITVYTPAGTAYLRAHAPDVHGDSALGHRWLIAETVRARKTHKGLEPEDGVPYPSAATPLYRDGQFIGVVEIGSSFASIVDAIKTITGGEAALLIGPRVAEASDSVLFSRVTRFLSPEDNRSRAPIRQVMTVEGKTYAASLIQLTDLTGRNAGVVAILSDASGFIRALNDSTVIILVISCLGIALAATLLIGLARRLDRFYGDLELRVEEKTRAEEALRASEARKAAILESALDCIITMDHEGRIVEFNPSAERTFGYPRAEVIGRLVAEVIIPPSQREQHRRGIANYLATGEGPVLARRLELTGMRADGSEFPVELTINRVGTGWPPLFTAFLRDFGERKRLEDQLRQAQKIEAVGRLAGGVAHDFNNLLTVIGGRSELVLRRLAPDDPLRRHVELVRMTAERATGLTQQLLAFSRKQMLQPKVLDLNAAVAGIEKILRRLIGEDIDFVTARGPALGCARVDPAQIEQVIMNLVVNARDAMPHGGRLIIETGNVELDDAFVRAHPGARAGLYVMLGVTDTGVGMDAETRSRVFEPFFTTKDPGKGTGLGLATVYGIVKQHDGYVLVESEPGRGATFRIYFPRVEDAPAAAETRPVLEGLAVGSETILLVEDEEGLRELAREVLEMQGYRVLEARHPGEGLLVGKRSAGRIDLLVTDVVMPTMSGRDLADRLHAIRPTLKVLYMSGYTDDAIIHHGVLLHQIDFLAKPFTPEALVRKVREVLDGKQVRVG